MLPDPWWRAAVAVATTLVQGGLLMIAVIVMLVTLGVDLLYGVINPRIRHK